MTCNANKIMTRCHSFSFEYKLEKGLRKVHKMLT